jgi:hypothetical protein
VSRQNLREREAAIAIDELSGKISVQRARDHFKSKGLIPYGQDAVELYELEQTRKLMQAARKYRSKSDDVQLEMVNLYEVLEDGTRNQYYRKFGELTAEEGVQLLKYWYDRERYASKQFLRYHGPLIQKHGRRIQRLLKFGAPNEPVLAN